MDNFDEKLGCFVFAFWFAGVLVSLGVLGVVVWAVIKLVNHFAG